MRTELERMKRDEMNEMLQWRFIQAGGKVFPFEAQALEELYRLTKGHPRSVCGIAVLSLEVAAARNTFITPEIITEAANKRFVD